jgi:hypothetical protein
MMKQPMMKQPDTLLSNIILETNGGPVPELEH